jgi:hypothetical protein
MSPLVIVIPGPLDQLVGLRHETGKERKIRRIIYLVNTHIQTASYNKGQKYGVRVFIQGSAPPCPARLCALLVKVLGAWNWKSCPTKVSQLVGGTR